MNRIARAGLAVAVMLFALTALFTPHHVTSSHRIAAMTTPPLAPRTTVAVPRDDAIEPDPPSDETDETIDLYGNDVSSAVATYSFDALGSLYEMHSPQIELPRLGSPKT